jgi:hypothetical protein
MPRYFFHIRQGATVIPDEEGTVLDHPKAAELEAVRTASGMLRDAERGGPSVHGQDIVVVDEGGTVIATVPIRRPLL